MSVGQTCISDSGGPVGSTTELGWRQRTSEKITVADDTNEGLIVNLAPTPCASSSGNKVNLAERRAIIPSTLPENSDVGEATRESHVNDIEPIDAVRLGRSAAASTNGENGNVANNFVSLIAVAAAAVAARSNAVQIGDTGAISPIATKSYHLNAVDMGEDTEGLSHITGDEHSMSTTRLRIPPQTLFTGESSLPFSAQHSAPHTNVMSRNAAKTLKCPKCNWHYKYQETLEIHMREKHAADDDSDASGCTMKQRIEACTYCRTQRSHPRLGRGETYSCGYKPYRCEVCNYSTTSKGNLSIHMQSDKHLNNVAEQQKLKQRSATVASDMREPDNSMRSVSENYGKTDFQTSTSTVKNDKQRKSPTSTTPSDKLSLPCPVFPPPNVSSFVQLAPSTRNISASVTSTASPVRNKYECKLCHYETSFSRNLSIHQSSDKHQQKVSAARTASASSRHNSVPPVAGVDFGWERDMLSSSVPSADGGQVYSTSALKLMQMMAPQKDEMLNLPHPESENTSSHEYSSARNPPFGSANYPAVPITSTCSGGPQLPATDLSAWSQKVLLQMLSFITAAQTQASVTSPTPGLTGSEPVTAEPASLPSLDGQAMIWKPANDNPKMSENITAKDVNVNQDLNVVNLSADTDNSGEAGASALEYATENLASLTKHSFLVYQCCVCNNFATDLADDLRRHMDRDWLGMANAVDRRAMLNGFAQDEVVDDHAREFEQQCALCGPEDIVDINAHIESVKHVQLAQTYFHVYHNGDYPQSHVAARARFALLFDGVKEVSL